MIASRFNVLAVRTAVRNGIDDYELIASDSTLIRMLKHVPVPAETLGTAALLCK